MEKKGRAKHNTEHWRLSNANITETHEWTQVLQKG